MNRVIATGKLSDDQRDHLIAVAQELTDGYFGGFAAAIGDAMLLADSYNLDRLRITFCDLIDRAEERMEANDVHNK